MPKNKKCILIVDDEFINREVMKNVFEACYTFEEAYDGEGGLAAALKYQDKLCAILLDVNMPKMNGLELLREFNRIGLTEKIPVFLVTAHEEFDIAREAYELGVMDVINKPIIPFVILRRVQSVVELFRAREALAAEVKSQEVKLQESSDRIDALHRATIESLASAIEFRDVESGAHTNRIYGITKHLLSKTAMGDGFSDEDIENMAIGSIMHDIGKIAISDIILNKPAKLTREEYEVMKLHTVKGGELMRQISKAQSHDSYVYACDIALHHHERWDGGGYPDGLRGDEITVWSQVVSIADVYDALVSPRVYKKAFDPDVAVNMIKNGECGVFNPKLLECFLEVEPEIRKWYAEDEAESKNTGNESATALDSPHLSRGGNEVVSVLLLMAAVESAYDLIISVNLTKNTYHMIDSDKFLTRAEHCDGVFDELITGGAEFIPEPDKSAFVATFSRGSLLRAYAEGKNNVSLRHKQYSIDGGLHNVETTVLLMQDTRTLDILEITLARYID